LPPKSDAKSRFFSGSRIRRRQKKGYGGINKGFRQGVHLSTSQTETCGERRSSEKEPFMDGNSSASSRINSLNPSSFTFKPDSNLTLLHNDRNPAPTVRVFQHSVQLVGIIFNIKIFHIPTFFGISFTSLDCMGSGTFAKNQYFFRHGRASLPHDINFLKFQGFADVVLVRIFNSY